MLGELIHCDLSTHLPSSNFHNRRVQEEVSARILLDPLLRLVDSGQIDVSGERDRAKLRFVRERLLALSTETFAQLLSDNLYDLAMGLVHHPRFGLVAQEILTVLKKSDLPHAEQAAHQLNVLSGHGGSASEYLLHTIQKLAQPGQYGPLAFAVGSASLLGKGVRVLGQAWLRGGRIAAWGGQLAVHGTSGVLALGAEAFYFPAGNNLGLGLLGYQMNWQHYGGEVLHGIQLMGGLNLAGLVSRNLGRAIHGVNEFGIATRVRALAPVLQPALNLGFEWGTVSWLNYRDGKGDGVFSFIEGGATLLNIRIARHSGEALVPALRAAHHSLDRALYRVGREASSGMWRRLVSGWNGGRNLGEGNSELGFGVGSLATAGMGRLAPGLTRVDGNRSNPAGLLEAYYQGEASSGAAGPEGSKQIEVTQAIRDGIRIPPNYFTGLLMKMNETGSGERRAEDSSLSPKNWTRFYKIVEEAATGKKEEYVAVLELLEVLNDDLKKELESHEPLAESEPVTYRVEGDHTKGFGKINGHRYTVMGYRRKMSGYENMESHYPLSWLAGHTSDLETGMRQYLEEILGVKLDSHFNSRFGFRFSKYKDPSRSTSEDNIEIGTTVFIPEPVNLLDAIFSTINQGLLPKDAVNAYGRRTTFGVITFEHSTPNEIRAMLRQGEMPLMISPFDTELLHYSFDSWYSDNSFICCPLPFWYHDLRHILVMARNAATAREDIITFQDIIARIAPKIDKDGGDLRERLLAFTHNLGDRLEERDKPPKEAETLEEQYRNYFDVIGKAIRTYHWRFRVGEGAIELEEQFQKLFHSELESRYLIKGLHPEERKRRDWVVSLFLESRSSDEDW